MQPDNARLKEYCLGIFRDVYKQGGLDPSEIISRLDVVGNERNCYSAMISGVLVIVHYVGDSEGMSYYKRRGGNLLENLHLSPQHALSIAEGSIDGDIGYYILTTPRQPDI